MATMVTPRRPGAPAKPKAAPAVHPPAASDELAQDLGRLETEERGKRDREQEDALARLRELARFD